MSSFFGSGLGGACRWLAWEEGFARTDRANFRRVPYLDVLPARFFAEGTLFGVGCCGKPTGNQSFRPQFHAYPDFCIN